MSDSLGPAPRRFRVERRTTTASRRDATDSQHSTTDRALRGVHVTSLMRAQRRLSVSVAVVVLVMVFGLPALLNLVPGLSELRLMGINAVWIALGIAIYPTLWVVGRFYERHANRIEDEYRQVVSEGER